MKELTKPISEVRQKLPALAKAADERMARVVITQQGRPQAVLLGYEDYLGLKTAVELLSRPGLVEGMEAASAELESGEGIPLEEIKDSIAEQARFGGKAGFATKGIQARSNTARGLGLAYVELQAKALLNKGNALSQLGKPDEAIASYDKVLGLLSPPLLSNEGRDEALDVSETKSKR